MSREIQVIAWCDGDHDGNEPATVARTVAIDGGTPILVDLCEPHDKIVSDLLRLLAGGVPASKAVTAAKARGAAPKRKSGPAQPPEAPIRADGRDRTDCLEEGCGYVGATRGALGQHIYQKHGKKVNDYDWSMD